MPTTAWRFAGTEGADAAVLRLKRLDAQDLINVVDIAVLRWPEYATEPTTQEHVHEQGGKVASMVRRLQRPVIDGSMIESVKGDMRPGTSAVVLLSSGAEIDAVVHAFEGQPMELIKRVEMITGPGGVLWGSNSLLGILNLITKDAEDVDGVEMGATVGDGPGDQMMARAYAMVGKSDLLDGKHDFAL